MKKSLILLVFLLLGCSDLKAVPFSDDASNACSVDYEYVESHIGSNEGNEKRCIKVLDDSGKEITTKICFKNDNIEQVLLYHNDEINSHVNLWYFDSNNIKIEKIIDLESISFFVKSELNPDLFEIGIKDNIHAFLKEHFVSKEIVPNVFELLFFDDSMSYGFLEFYVEEEHRFPLEELFNMQYDVTVETSQDIEVFGDYLFVAFSESEKIRIYSLASGSLLAELMIETFHGSSMQFSNVYYKKTDIFPLLYVGGSTTNKINVIRVTIDEEVFTAESIRILSIPKSHGYYASPSIDPERNILYVYSNEDPLVVGSKAAIISKWNLDRITLCQDGTFVPEFISECRANIEEVYQGHKYFDGYIYMVTSNISHPCLPKIVRIDVDNGVVEIMIDLSELIDIEMEGLCFKKDDNFRWILADYCRVYLVDFEYEVS